VFNLKLGNLFVTLTATATQFHSVLTKAQAHIISASRTIRRYGTMMTMALTAPLVLFGAAAAKVFGSFDSKMTQSLAIMQNVSAGMRKEMEGVAKSIARNSITSADKLAEAYFFLASAGLSAVQSIKALPIVEKFAVAGMFDMASATSLLADAQSSLGMKSKDAVQNMRGMVRVSDVLVKANTLANASVLQFSKSLTRKAGASLRMVNKSVEEGVAVLAAFADQGIKGELAGQRLSIVLRDLQRTAIKFPEVWDKFNLSVFDSSGKMLPMAIIIEQIEKKLSTMSDRAKKTTLQMLGFQERSVAALQSLLGTSGRIKEYEKALRSAGGTTEEVANRQLKSFSAQLKITWNRIQELARSIGEKLAPYIIKLGEQIASLTDKWKKLDESTKDFIVRATAFVAALGPALILISKIATVFALALPVIKAVGSAFIFVGGVLASLGIVPLLLGIAAAVVLIGFGVSKLPALWDSAKSSMQLFWAYAKGFIANFTVNLQILTKWIQDNWRAVWHNATVLFKWFTGNIGIGTKWIRYHWRSVLDDLVRLTQTAFRNIVPLSETLFNTWAKMFGAFNTWVLEQFTKLFSWDLIKVVVNSAIKMQVIWAKLGAEMAKAMWAGLTSGTFTPFNFFKQFLAGAEEANSTSDIFKTLGDIATDGLKELQKPFEKFELKTMHGPIFRKLKNAPFAHIEGPKFVYNAMNKGAEAAVKSGGEVTKTIEEQTKATDDLTDSIKKQQEQQDVGFKQGNRVALFGLDQQRKFTKAVMEPLAKRQAIVDAAVPKVPAAITSKVPAVVQAEAEEKKGREPLKVTIPRIPMKELIEKSLTNFQTRQADDFLRTHADGTSAILNQAEMRAKRQNDLIEKGAEGLKGRLSGHAKWAAFRRGEFSGEQAQISAPLSKDNVGMKNPQIETTNSILQQVLGVLRRESGAGFGSLEVSP